jgi:hypothetical protein
VRGAPDGNTKKTKAEVDATVRALGGVRIGQAIAVYKKVVDRFENANKLGHRKHTARLWDAAWVTLVRGELLRERVCAEKFVGAVQDFSSFELEDPILRGVTQTNPCLRRGPRSLDYWISLPGEWWASISS